MAYEDKEKSLLQLDVAKRKERAVPSCFGRFVQEQCKGHHETNLLVLTACSDCYAGYSIFAHLRYSDAAMASPSISECITSAIVAMIDDSNAR